MAHLLTVICWFAGHVSKGIRGFVLKEVSKAQVEKIVAQSEMIMGSPEEPMLLLTPAGELIKLFYRKKRFTTAILFPRAIRFVNNGRRLREKGVMAPLSNEVIYCSEMALHMVTYDPLPGKDLRALRDDGNELAMTGLPEYLAELHMLGVVFRGIHLGNILFLNKQAGQIYALVDIAGMTIKNRPLRIWERSRNLINLLGVDDDKDVFDEVGVNWFLSRYCHAAALDSRQVRYISWQLSKKLKKHVRIDPGGHI
jgi:hypothetical protein